MRVAIYSYLLFCSLFWRLSAQETNTYVSVHVNNYSVAQVLLALNEQVSFDFSYDSDLISPELKLNIDKDNTPISSVFDEISTKANVDYKYENKRLEFYKKNQSGTLRSTQTISGIIIDNEKNKALSKAVIYDSYMKHREYSDASGKFQLQIHNPDYKAKLICKKEGYQTKLFEIHVNNNKTLLLYLTPLDSATIAPIDMDSVADIKFKFNDVILNETNDSIKRSKLTLPVIQGKMLKTIIDTRELLESKTDSLFISENIQVGIVPGISSQSLNKANTINKGLSLQLLVGMSAGTNGAEIGGLVNINRHNLKGIQLSGLTNIVGGQLTGAQVGGLNNISKLKTKGVQIAGITNIAGLDVKGAQFGGIGNVIRGEMLGGQFGGIYNVLTEKGTGAQFGGIFNLVNGEFTGSQVGGIFNLGNDDFTGLQAAGIFNTLSGNIEGVQIAGIQNFCSKEVLGGQLAGLFNFAKGVKGIQCAGLINVSKEVKGAQIAGLINLAKNVHGTQLGIINIADSISGGTPFGLLSFYHRGFKRFNFSYHDYDFAWFTLKTGVPKLYNMLSLGSHFSNNYDPSYFGYGYGIGGMSKPERRLYIGWELQSLFLNPENWHLGINLLNQVRINLGVRIWKRLAITGGPTLNVYVVHKNQPAVNTLLNEVTNWEGQNRKVVTWLGYQFGFEF